MFSKAPKRSKNLAEEITAKKGLPAQGRSASASNSQGVFAKRKHLHNQRFLIAGKFSQNQPVLFVTIDKSLDKVDINATLSVKAEAAKKMFASTKR